MSNIGTVKKSLLFRVQDITRNIREFLEGQFPRIGIRGELSSFVRHPSGHWYFTLKDTKSQIQGVMFQYANKKVSFMPKLGEEVTVWGKITVYEPRGSYQVLADQMEKAGEGFLQKSFEELKEKLKKEGLFERKTPLPYLPQHIAIITSESGAALRDVLNVLHRRCKGIQVTIAPALMEGKNSALSVRMAFKQVLKLKNIDLILITRGGGSAESLWTFNDEALARVVFDSPLPVVSAIGHEIDFTILDFVSDLRAATPSAAAELIAKDGEELEKKVEHYRKTLISHLSQMFQFWRKQVLQYQNTLPSPLSKIEDYQLKCDDYVDRILNRLKHIFELHTQNVQKFKGILHQLDPKQIMSRGYSLCFQDDRVIKNIESIDTRRFIQIQFFKGTANAQITKKSLNQKE